MIAGLVSIVIPCYNQAVFLKEALQSVVNQTYDYWECIIINDGSFDDTPSIATSFVETDKRFKYIYKENGGLSSARNVGIAHSKGEFIQFLDSDDYINPQKLELSVQEFEKKKELGVVITDFKMFTEDVFKPSKAYCQLSNEVLDFEALLFKWDIDFTIPIHCGVFNSELVKSIKFNESLKSKEDWFFWVNLFLAGAKGNFIPDTLAFYRIHPNSMSKNREQMEENLLLCYKHFTRVLPEKYAKDFACEIYDRLFRKYIDSEIVLQGIFNSKTFKLRKSIGKVKSVFFSRG